MWSWKKILSASLLAIALVLYLLAGYRKFVQGKYDEENQNNVDRDMTVLLVLSVLCIAAATGLAVYNKDDNLKPRDYLNMTIILFSIVLMFLAAYGQWGFFSHTLIIGIALLSSGQFLDSA